MGKDCERILSGISEIKDNLALSIRNLANTMTEPIETTGPHNPLEIEHKGEEISQMISAMVLINEASTALSSMQGDIDKMGSLKGTLYTDASSFNNGYGSPWTELTKMKEAVEVAKEFASNNPMLKYVNPKAAMLGLLNLAYSACVDARWALIVYHDYIQRGYDSVYNGNKPSITFDEANGGKGTGNVDQDYSENVNTSRPSYDPF